MTDGAQTFDLTDLGEIPDYMLRTKPTGASVPETLATIANDNEASAAITTTSAPEARAPGATPAPGKTRDASHSTKDRIAPITLNDFLALDIPPRGYLLKPILPEQGLAMLVAQRGVGKTHVALGIAYAAASGGSFLRYTAERPRKVLVLDGEMPAALMQSRMAAIVAGSAVHPPAPDYFRLVTPDALPKGATMPNLGDPEGQAVVEQMLDGVELLVIDNLSSLVRGLRENEADDWQGMLDFLLRLRRRGVTVLLVHHANKNGTQRGTSRREDILDTVIALKRPADYQPAHGARFEVHIEKGRALYGTDAAAFEASLKTVDGRAVWTHADVEEVTLERVIALHQQGLSMRDIGDELDVGKSTVQRMLAKAKTEGLLSD